MKVADIRAIAGTKTASILQKDYYGWFERVKMGHYQLSYKGQEAAQVYDYVIEKLL